MSPAFHGVLVTYRRHDALRTYLAALADQTTRLSHLVVVDNEPSDVVADIVASSGDAADRVSYVAMVDNAGPAGGIAAGLVRVLDTAHDDDWVAVLDDDDPPRRRETLEALRSGVREVTAVDPTCGAVGLWGATLNRSTGRLNFTTTEGPSRVDYVSGNSLPHYRVGALRVCGLGTPALFFGFDDLELCLGLRDGGFGVRSLGAASAHGFAEEATSRGISFVVGDTHWRRYYSLRNLIWIYRQHRLFAPALFVSVVAGIAKPLANLPLRPKTAVANLALNLAAVRDGWFDRLGRNVEPVTAGDR